MPSVESTVQSTDAVESLLLNENGLVGAALEHFGRCIEGGMTHKQILMQLQSVCASYACQGVKRNAGMTDNTKRQKTATNAYKEIVVPGFLKYLAEQSVPLPRWLTVEAMGCVNVSGLLSGKGASNKQEPRFYKDINKVWKRHQDDYCVIRRDLTPAYDRITAGQPAGQPLSGQQYPDQLSELLDEFWIINCKEKKLKRDPVDVERENEMLGPRASQSEGAVTKGADGGGASGRGCEGSGAPEQAAAGEKPGTEVEAADGGTGAPNGALSGTALGPEPPQDSPEYPQWLAQKAAAAAKASTAPESGGPSGDNTGDNEASEYPDRPENWMHSLTLTFCFFGRPAGDDEEKELSTCKEGSGPPNRGAKKNGRRGRKKASTSGSECGSSLGGVSDDESGPENPLHPGAVRQFVGAGESQSRAKVKKETAALMKQQSVDATRAQFVEQSKQQVELSTKMAASIEQVASDVGAQRALVEEDACRKRKKQVIEDLEAELKYCEPHELLGMKSKIRKLLKTPAAQFTKEFVDGGADTPAGPPAPGATPVVVTMPGFTGDSGTTGGATPSEGAVRAV